MKEQIRMQKPSVWKAMVHAPFKKVIEFDLLFMVLGAMMGAGIAVALFVH